MTKHRYSGPISSVTLEGDREINWFPGKVYEGLPTGNAYIARLIARGHLVQEKTGPVEPTGPTKSTKSKAKE
ncbi:MAG: hypothetical protein NXI18_19615 [Alphaproteobacteria bacterium]|nr:hypothetical protein [Alphaproteobacteria bacterium]